MIDARIFINSLESAEKILLESKAIFKGDYIIIDKIYRSKDSDQTINKIFLRLRLVPKNIWNEKTVIVSIKNTELKKVGKQSIIPVKVEFDSEKLAKQFIEQNYFNDFIFDFEFSRTGKQYFIGEDGIDLEVVEGYPSIEFKSKTEEGLRNLLSLFNVTDNDVIKGPSVVAIRDLLK